ncbi:MAG: hypothetical protein JW755_07475 [Candidatus Aminicenantes bacterium]|nr:hypothetical protein [Candidatus Aminicenantes bacterium]
MSLNQMTLGDFFLAAMEVEKKASEIYQSLSEAFIQKQDISLFWSGLREDELMHLKMLKKSREALSEKDLELLVDKSMISKIQEVDEFLKENPTEHVQDLNDAFELAHELEFSEVNVIFKFLTIDLVPWIYQEKLIENMIEVHQQKLIHFEDAFGNKEWRKTIKARNYEG